MMHSPLLFDQPAATVDLGESREVLLQVLEGVSRALGYERGLVLLRDTARASLRGAVGLNIAEAIAEALEVPLAATGSPIVSAYEEGHPVCVEDIRSTPGVRENTAALLEEVGIRSFVVLPLRATHPALPPRLGNGRPRAPDKESALGVIVLSKEEPITDADVERLLPFALHAGAALARASDADRLRDSNERYAIEKEWLWDMLNAVSDPVVLTDQKNDIILQNGRAESLFRANLQDSEGKRHAIWMNNFLFTAALSTSALEAGRDGRPGRELTLVDPIEGTELLFEVISRAVTNFFSGERGVVSVLKNITDLRHATEELSQSVQRFQTADEEARLERDRLRLLLESVPHAIVLMDRDNRISTMNPEAVRLFQTEQAARPGRRTQVCLSNAAKFTSWVAQFVLDAEPVRSSELVLTDPDSEEPLYMAVTTADVHDEHGISVGTVSVIQDVTRLRELERRRLEQALFESEKLAATGRLAASIAHEINNPLEAIKNSLYLLSHRTDSADPNHRFLQIATKETERVSRILRQMLGFYRPPKMEPTDVNRVIEEAEALVEKLLRQRRIRVQQELAADLPLVRASADQLKQVILNLLLNAHDAMPDGGEIHVSTRVAHQAEPDFLQAESVLIQVSDTGKGIPDEHLDHIFEPFFSTKQEQKGTGLGLWVCSGIVQSHGGSMKVRSRPGRGTTFSISLPIGGPTGDAEG